MSSVQIRLREVRKKRGLTQVQLAELTGIAQEVISRIETRSVEGSAKSINLDVLERLCEALKCRPGDLLVRKATEAPR